MSRSPRVLFLAALLSGSVLLGACGEDDAVDVDRLAERVRRASTLIRLCRGRIADARMQVESVVADLEQLDDPGPG